LILPFAAKRRWRAVGAAGCTFVALCVLAEFALGRGATYDYITRALPTMSRHRAGWLNISLPGFWFKLLDPAGAIDRTDAWVYAPRLARALAAASMVGLTAVVIRTAATARPGPESDRAFSAAIVGMFLVAPVVWSHYLVAALLPLACLATWPPANRLARCATVAAAACLWINPYWVYFRFHLFGAQHPATARPWQTLTLLAFQTYALALLFILGLSARVSWPPVPAPQSGEGKSGIASDGC
jgi:hypothetical protein